MIEYWKRNILETWNIFSHNYLLLAAPHLLSILILLLIGNFVGTSIESIESIPLPKAILVLALFLIILGVQLGAISMNYNAIIGKKIAFQNIFQQFDKLHLILMPQIGLITILFILINILPFSAYVFILIAAILSFLFLFFYDYLIIIENLSMKDAIIKNYSLVSSYPLLIAQFVLISFLIAFCLSIVQLIGTILSMCFIRIIGIKFFLMLSNQSK